MCRFVRAANEEELQVKNRQAAALLDDYTDHLHRRWAEICTGWAAPAGCTGWAAPAGAVWRGRAGWAP